jgi:ubiquinone/menaquinone biosynthesis C-methylase UbiE
MGRRSVPLSARDRWVFNRLADAYRARPPYPAALVERLAALAGGPGARVADLGAGTGDLALPLAARGLDVRTVEPARAMLDVLAGRARGAVTAVHATAEATTLPGAAHDLVLLADAAHWVDPELAGREAGRLLAPGGALAVVEASFAATPFMAGLAGLLARANARALPRPEGAVRQLFALATGQAPAAEPFLQAAPLDAAGLEAVVRSLSYAGPALGEAALAALLDEARALARAQGGAVFARDLTLRWARRRVTGWSRGRS